jgi:hypothetical protein
MHQNGDVNKQILSVLVFLQEMALRFTIVNFGIVEVEVKIETGFTPENSP